MTLKINKRVSPKWFQYSLSISIVVLGALAGWSLTVPDEWIAPHTKNFVGATLTMLVSIAKSVELLFFKTAKIIYEPQ